MKTKVSKTPNFADIDGLTVQQASAKFPGWKFRVIKEDNKSFMTTMDAKDNRVNVEVNDGVITSVTRIG